MRQPIMYSSKVNDSPPQYAHYRIFGQDVRIYANSIDVDQAIADELGITKVDLQALEIEIDNLRTQAAQVLDALDTDEVQRTTDFTATGSLLTLVDLQGIIRRQLQREQASITQRRRLMRIMVRILLNMEFRQGIE